MLPRPLVALALLLLCGCAAPDGGPEGDDVLLRTVVTLELQSRGGLEMDLTVAPPTMQAGYEDTTRVEVTDLTAARELRSRLLALPPTDDGCPRLRDPLFTARVATFPTPEDAPFADLAVHEVGGPCSELDEEDVQELVDLWNAAGGDLALLPRG